MQIPHKASTRDVKTEMPDEMAPRGSKPGSSAAYGRANALSWRDRTVGASLVLIVLAAQTRWMGPAIVLLSGGLVLAYGVWVAARWKNDAATVLPIYLLAIALQCLHFTEEYVTGFQHQFPRLFGEDWSDARFVTFNMLWLAAFVLAGLGVYRRVQLAYLIVLFLALIGGVGNGASHLVLSATYRGYFPGLITAPFCLLVGILLINRLFAGTQARPAKNSDRATTP
jgi:Protein of unknown function with HXXEE motif